MYNPEISRAEPGQSSPLRPTVGLLPKKARRTLQIKWQASRGQHNAVTARFAEIEEEEGNQCRGTETSGAV